jgi:hypothetical protein
MPCLSYCRSFFYTPVQKDTTYPPISNYSPIKTTAASNPVILKSDLQVNYVYQLPTGAVQIVYDSPNKILYTNTFEGDVYKTDLVNGNPQNSQLFISRNEHNISQMQGLLYHNGALYLGGNEANSSAKNGKGWLIKCAIGSGGSKTFSTVFQTDLYASSTTLFDHAFSVIFLNKTADTLLVASGSRTDHGEVKDVNGQYLGLREEPLTTKIYGIPITASNLYLQNNETWLQNSGYVYCEGVRNEYDIALNSNGEVFGLENMGDRDDPEDLNLLKRGKHYGFPWRMGGNLNPQQFSSYMPFNSTSPPYYPAIDKLLPPNLYVPEIFYNDPTFPTASGIVFEEPIKNIEPDANWVRNPVSGVFEQRNDVTTFTSYRSPLGLNFDVDSLLDVPYNASGFMLAYTTGGGGSGYLNSVDGGADVCQLKLIYNISGGKYNVQTTRLASGFDRLVDAILIENALYIMEETGHIYTLTFPVLTEPVADFTATIDDNCKKRVNITNATTGNLLSYSWNFNDGSVSNTENPMHNYLTSGNKLLSLSASNPRGMSIKTVNLNLPNSINLAGNPNVAKDIISGIGEITTNQQLNSSTIQQLFSIQNIQLLPGFTVNNGAIFSAKIKNDCQ